MEVKVGDIVEVSVWNGGLVDKGEVLEIFKFNGQREFTLKSQSEGWVGDDQTYRNH